MAAFNMDQLAVTDYDAENGLAGRNYAPSAGYRGLPCYWRHGGELFSSATIGIVPIMMGILDLVKEESTTQQAEGEATPPARHPRRFSLVHQASCETQHLAGVKRQNTITHRAQLEGGLLRGKQILQRLNDEGVELIWAADDGHIAFSAVLESSGSLPSFVGTVVKCFNDAGIDINHIETRPSKKDRRKAGSLLEISEKTKNTYDLLLDCVSSRSQLVAAAAELIKEHPELNNFSLYKKSQQLDVPWFPRHVSELDQCSNCVTKYEPTTDPRHPGHGDANYIARREFLNDQAKEFKHGDPIPFVSYTEDEHATWKAVYQKLRGLHESHTCETYRKNLKMLELEGVLHEERIPQIRDVNRFLQKRTGFILRPCSGLLSARDFLASLAYRVFQTTTYLRHSGSPHHSPEPDLVHELLGHVPMFADPLIAQMSQDIGLMSLGASDEQIEKLSTVYWFIVEFGLCREDGRLKAIGAGLISAYGELMHACSSVPEHRPFDPALTAIQKYEDSEYQPLYFVAESIQTALDKLRQYALSMDRPFSVVYDAITQSVEMVRQPGDLESAFSRFRLDFASITNAVDVIEKSKQKAVKAG